MGFVITVLYLVSAYLGPATIFGPLVAAHIGLILAGLVVLVTVPKLPGSLIWKTPQSLALIGLAFATFLSVVVTGWTGGATQVFLNFIPNAFAYFIVCLHCNSMKKLRVTVLMMLFVCLFVIANGYFEVQHQPLNGPTQTSAAVGLPQESAETHYFVAQTSDAGEWFYRIRGQDFISDPNDFAQVIVCVIPLVFIFWRPRKLFTNTMFVMLPICVLLFGAYLTHSRGGLLAILAMAIVAARRRIGTLPSLLVAIVLFVGASALQFTGGRAISADSGSGRMDLWGQGLQLLRSHPLFGVGFGRMPDYTDMGLTAHNSVVVCAAETGLIGLYFWSLFLFPTVRDALVIASPEEVSEGKPLVPETTRFPSAIKKPEELDMAEVNRVGRLLLLSLTGFLVAAWFLSRAFTMTLFLLGGLVQVVFEMALQRGMIAPRMQLARAMRYAGGFTISLLVMTYIVLRLGNVMR
jgi:O-antigen ligase